MTSTMTSTMSSAMPDPLDLDRLRSETPHCAGIAWFAGAPGEPLGLVAASGDPPATEWPSWDAVGQAAPALLRDGPVASPEVLLLWPSLMVLLAERATGVVVVAVALTKAGTGVALVHARMAASQVAA
jgi:hypothetical protein